MKPTWAAEAFTDLDADVRQNIARIHAEPAIPIKDSVRGFVYDVASGTLRESTVARSDAPMKKLLTFPNPVNEYAARSVAGMVVLLCIATLVFRTPWLLWPLALGFVARVASGPRFSPFGQLATKVIAPRLGPPKLVPGPPKRFAQTIGATLSVGALVAFYLGAPTVSWVLVGLITIAATLESVFGFCLGCAIFAGCRRSA